MQVSYLFTLGRLAEEFVLDQYSCIQSQRRQFLLNRARQGQMRSARGEVGSGLSTRAAHGPVGGPGGDANRSDRPPGRQLPPLLPSSIPGSRAYQKCLIDDGLAIMRDFGAPTLFITMTANPAWPEIAAAEEVMLGRGRRSSPSQVVINRVFRRKAELLLQDLREGLTFQQPAVYLLWVYEFQKRGLPHIHIAVRFRGEQPLTAEGVDRWASCCPARPAKARGCL